MSEGRPRLVAVGGEGRGEKHPSGPSGRHAPRELGRWLLVGACVVLALALLHEVNRARRLEADLSQSRSELAAARADLAASRDRVQEARTRTKALVGDASALAQKLQALDGLLASPASPRPQPAGAPDHLPPAP